MAKLLNTIQFILKPVDSTISYSGQNKGISVKTNTSGSDIIKSIFWLTAAVLVSILISSL